MSDSIETDQCSQKSKNLVVHNEIVKNWLEGIPDDLSPEPDDNLFQDGDNASSSEYIEIYNKYVLNQETDASTTTENQSPLPTPLYFRDPSPVRRDAPLRYDSNDAGSDSNETAEVIEKMQEDENKYEVCDLIQREGSVWTIAVPLDIVIDDDQSVKIVVYSYERGIRRITLSADQMTSDLKHSNLLKYRRNRDRSGYMAIPLRSAMPSTQLMTLKIRYNRGIDLKVYGLINFVDFEKDPDAHSQDTVVWTDSIGIVRITPAERTQLWRRQIHSESEVFAPLRLCSLTIKADFTITSKDGFHPKFTVHSAVPILEEFEEDDKSVKVGRSLWPARVSRFDDLVVTNRNSDGMYFTSCIDSRINVFASVQFEPLIDLIENKNERKGVFSAIVYPLQKSRRGEKSYEALIIGPLKVLECLTENRILNFCPKTWPPSVLRRISKEQRKCQEFERKLKKNPLYIHDTTRVKNLYDHGIKWNSSGCYEL